MATWRTIAATETDPEAPITSSLMKALADNPQAIAEGEAGAPRIVDGALSTTVTGTGQTWVGQRLTAANIIAASASGAGVVGSYAFLRLNAGGVTEGVTTSGSNLTYSSSANNVGGTPGGTWRCMGNVTGGNATLFLRIA